MQILILGWYGTETVGDKAILGGIIQHYRRENPKAQFIVASIYPFITKRTLHELNIEAKVIATFSFQFIQYCAISDLVVMGGGPLMNLTALSIPLWGFQIAKAFRKHRVIFGCGLGPLDEGQFQQTVTRILMLANEVLLRDTNSIELAKTLYPRTDYALYGDPAERYVESIKDSLTPSAKANSQIAVFMRDWTHEYAAYLSDSEFATMKRHFEETLATCLKEIVHTLPSNPSIIFYPMHCFAIGNDDRIFNRSFVAQYLDSGIAVTIDTPSSVNSIAQAMLDADLCICMRFHSVVFAHTLQRKFLALDYTLGGKIYGFLKDKQALANYFSAKEFDSQLFTHRALDLLK